MDASASTRCHETVHWSGHQKRLARTFGKPFGDNAYAFEELVAEIGAGLCCAELGLPNTLHDGHASYIDHWLGILHANKTAILLAATKAEQAVSYLKGFAATAEPVRSSPSPPGLSSSRKLDVREAFELV